MFDEVFCAKLEWFRELHLCIFLAATYGRGVLNSAHARRIPLPPISDPIESSLFGTQRQYILLYKMYNLTSGSWFPLDRIRSPKLRICIFIDTAET